MPLVEAGGYLLHAWADLGRADVAPGMGMAPLRFSEMAAGCPWTTDAERRVLRRMSEAYLAGMQVGKDVLGIAPWEGDE